MGIQFSAGLSQSDGNFGISIGVKNALFLPFLQQNLWDLRGRSGNAVRMRDVHAASTFIFVTEMNYYSSVTPCIVETDPRGLLT